MRITVGISVRSSRVKKEVPKKSIKMIAKPHAIEIANICFAGKFSDRYLSDILYSTKQPVMDVHKNAVAAPISAKRKVSAGTNSNWMISNASDVYAM
jgi:hypothetical protein